MPTRDLPPEMWSEIASYLSRSELHKAMGINRTLFRLVTDDLYKEIRLVSNGKRTTELFERVKRPQVAHRVRRLVVRPDFLPPLEERPIWYDSLERLRQFPYLCPLPLGEPDRKSSVVFQTVREAMALCPDVREVKIVLYDHRFTGSFNRFLLSLWQTSVGTRLRSLSIDTTWTKIPRFLQPLVTLAETLKSLQEFSLDIRPSRIGHDQLAVDVTVQSLKSFLLTYSEQLTALTLSSPTFFEDIAVSLGSIPTLAGLEKLEIFAFFDVGHRQFEYLTHIFAQNASTLRHLTLKPQPRYRSGRTSHLGYSNWINPAAHDEQLRAFTEPLHRLDVLHLGLCGGPEDDDFWVSKDELTSRVLPKLCIFAPHVTSLVLTGLPLTFERLRDLIGGLGVGNGGRKQLGSLRVGLLITSALSSALFDLLASELGSLKNLEINYYWSVDSQTNTVPGPDNVDLEERFLQEMEVKRYDEWKLAVLRLTKFETCPAPHPSLPLMEAVAARFHPRPHLDCSYNCSC